MVKTQTKTETYECGRGFAVDVVRTRGEYEAWIYHVGYGVKEIMFSAAEESVSYDGFLRMIDAGIEKCAETYADTYLGREEEEEGMDNE